ncbi:hypothetical protein TVAG_257390 [Trichomonas vaginalis G3]|uniref:Uncharacterized protein n=1 Tax=Trichomonas vaginalis (strain ATCC PRA-98 / G3) TaxID=412133 RepID=A2ELH3_TRIV3|nr:hypothetical protein TVAGG3_0005180 [Trichomonas vaginalis G3]EAY06500.1 hypothetical protein TVAG_257390 [Trichomonas vaginalis G3]KAI5538865.1 hypothetical protein TVAGG3_0005180 [Trichomonas vaginalis G3]|eukprot:XP_001318723.1 hypothetical protein [Trichomonas vaginalis G3]
MDFDAYFQATEEAFAQEKEDMLMKLEKKHEYWKNASELDQKLIDRCKEMLYLKRMVGKGHLQILRTKEECLHMQLKNSQLRFHIRQLQKEIDRLIPFSHTQVPSTEYIMSLDRAVFKAPPHAKETEADEEHMKDIQRIHKLWENLCDQQAKVFAEETLHQQEDSEQWDKFTESVQMQNANAHKMIDKTLADILGRHLSLKSSNEDMVKSGEERANSLERKLNRLKKRVEKTMTSLNNKKGQDKILAQREANKLTKELKRRVQFMENVNQQMADEIQEDIGELQDDEDDLLDDIDELNKKISTYNLKNKELNDEGKQKLENFQAQLNALISAAAAIKDTPLQEQINIIGAVSTAVGAHGKAATAAERIKHKVAYLNKRLENQMADLQLI